MLIVNSHYFADCTGIVLGSTPQDSIRNGIPIHDNGITYMKLIRFGFEYLRCGFLKLWYFVQTADIDEKSIRKETPEELVMALAEAKVRVLVITKLIGVT